MSEPTRLELSVKVKRMEDGKERAVFDSAISMPIQSEDRSAIVPLVEQWLAMMDAALKVIPLKSAALESHDA